jgi:uncharacterized protein (TIGR03118 family)
MGLGACTINFLAFTNKIGWYDFTGSDGRRSSMEIRSRVSRETHILMNTFTIRFFTRRVADRVTTVALGALAIWIASVCVVDAGFVQTNLVSDIPGLAANTDPNVKNPWGIASSATSPFWVSDNGTGVSTVHNSSGTPLSLVVTIPPAPGASGAGNPTGVVFNGSSDFVVGGTTSPAIFLFASENGTISGWAPPLGTTAAIQVDNSAAGAVYKGVTIGNNGSQNFLYAANFGSNTIDVFNGVFTPTMSPGAFTDPNLPAGFAPFNVQNLGGTIFVTYAKVDPADPEEDLPGPGNGFVDQYDANGTLIRRLISDSVLNSPWGLAIAPDGFGKFANSLLVGNFGDGRINAFDPVTGDFLGFLKDTSGDPIEIEGLWGLRVGNGGDGGDPDKVYFAAGINDENNGLFGSLASTPDSASTLVLLTIAVGAVLWMHQSKRKATL